jgi:hypothetical protein
MTPRKNDLQALRNMIAESHDILATTILPEGRAERAHELLNAAVGLADNLLAVSPAATLGGKGGRITVKLYGNYGQHDANAKYSPGPIADVIIEVRRPDPRHISMSYIERSNLTLTMRMSIRRLTRLTNAFSKKLDNLKAACALHFAYYNFYRIHKSLRVTSCMQAGLANHIWTLRELLQA